MLTFFYKRTTLHGVFLLPLAARVVSGFCLYCILSLFTVNAEQEWRIVLLPADIPPIKSDMNTVKQVLNNESDSTHKPKKIKGARSQAEPFNYGTLHSTSTGSVNHDLINDSFIFSKETITPSTFSSSKALTKVSASHNHHGSLFNGNLYKIAIEQALASQLISADFEVLDKSLILKRNHLSNGLSKHKKSELDEKVGSQNNVKEDPTILIDSLAEPITEPIERLKEKLSNNNQVTHFSHIETIYKTANLIIRYQLSIQRQATQSVPKWHISLNIVLLDVLSKNQIESHQEKFTVSGLPQNCSQTCEKQWFIKHVSQVARDAGAVIVKKLQHIPRRFHYKLSFYNFNLHELNQLQLLLDQQPTKVFSELLSHLDIDHNAYELLSDSTQGRQYRYVSLLPNDQLDLVFNQFFIEHQWRVNTSNKEGNAFSFTRQSISLVERSLYVGVRILVIFIILALLFFWLKRSYAKNQTKQQSALHQKSFDLTASGLIKQLKTPTEPYQALSLIDEFLNTFQLTSNEVVASKAFSIKQNLFYKKLTTLRNNYCEKIEALTGHITANQWHIYQLTENTPVYLGREPSYETDSITKNESEFAPQSFITINYHGLLACRIIDSNVNTTFSDNFTESNNKVLNAVSFSSLQNKVYIRSHFNDISHQHCILNNEALVYNVPKQLISQKTTSALSSIEANQQYNRLSLGRENNDAAIKQENKQAEKMASALQQVVLTNPCQLLIRERDNNILLRVDDSIEQLCNIDKLSILWPDFHIDVTKKWILQTNKLAIGYDLAGDLIIGCFNDEPPVAWLHYSTSTKKGYSISLVEYDNTQDNHAQRFYVFINGVRLYGKVPLSRNAEITFDMNKRQQSIRFN